MMFCAVLAAVFGILSAGDVSLRSDGTVACDPALRPVVISTTGSQFSSLGYNGSAPYAPNLLCEYVFQASDTEDVILTFDDFLTEECTDCNCDYMELYDGSDDTGTLIGRYCGGDASAPPASVSAGNSAFIRFVTDATTHGTGFIGTYTAGNAACEGGVVLTAPTGNFTSPRYPLNYPNNADCTWTFSPPDTSYKVDIWFNSMDLENSCNYDMIDMVDSNGDRMNKWWWGAGPSDPNFIFSSYPGQGDVSLHFTADSSITDTGFSGGWRFVQEA